MNKVEVKEKDKTINIIIKEPEEPIIRGKSEPDERIINYGITKNGELKILEIAYPKSIYNFNNVSKVAEELDNIINKAGCSRCVIMSVTSKAKKSFAIPTLRDILEVY